ncbi:MAG: phosphoenolpyruvate--protein phosphotransferase, partial [Burkholderiales bacterium]|nr:phosphoenolpyruvate--protein phosphotransferase [Burkholderiales bacterium]
VEIMQDDITNVDEALSNIGNVVGTRYYGTVASSGMAVGKLIKKVGVNFYIQEYSQDNAREQSRLFSAIDEVKRQIDENLQKLSRNENTIKDILSAHLLLLTDPHLLSQILTLIKLNKTAEFALNFVINKECEILANTGNKLLIERQSDLQDIKNRVMAAMEGVQTQKLLVNEPSILIAHELKPSDLLGLDKNIVGLVSVEGGATSHVAILAKSLDIPLLIGVSPKVLAINVDKPVILNSKLACLLAVPSTDEIEKIHQLKAQEQIFKYENRCLALNNAITTDNVQINCMGNIVGEKDAIQLYDNGAEGVGLFRTEFIYYDRDEVPSQDIQYQIYSNIANILQYKPFIIRTLDAGGEKQIPSFNMKHEINPALGVRGIRLCLRNRNFFEDQLIAILKLNKPNVKIMLPMISTIEEYRQSRELIDELKVKLLITTNIEIGIMVEVPSVVLQSEIFAKEVDFFSIGTNDLTQYTLAIDREHSVLAPKIDHLHPAVLRSIDLVVKGANKYNKLVSVCGMMASEKTALPVLIGLGITNLSMNINSIADNKAFIRKLSKNKCTQIANNCLNFATSGEVRSYLLEQFPEII